MLPRVSCVMITANRKRFIRRSVDCFINQRYPNRELVIFDSGGSPIKEELPAELTGPGRMIRYYHNYFGVGRERTVGQLRNAVNDVSNGDLIKHWDDDDWYNPDCLSYSVEQLGEAKVGGFYNCLFWDEVSSPPALWKYDGGPKANALGSSLIYQRSFWRHNQFLSTPHGEDNGFQDPDLNGGVKPVVFPGIIEPSKKKGGSPGRVFLIARMHETNSQRNLVHDIIRLSWEQDRERIDKVWSKLEDEATIERVRSLVQ